MSCGGVWTDTLASRRIATTVDRELVGIARDAAKRAAESERDLGSSTPPDAARACPICEGPLTCVRSGHVPVDVCATHGTWFDRDELGRLARNLEFDRLSSEPAPPGSQGEPTSRSAEMLLELLGRQP